MPSLLEIRPLHLRNELSRHREPHPNRQYGFDAAERADRRVALPVVDPGQNDRVMEYSFAVEAATVLLLSHYPHGHAKTISGRRTKATPRTTITPSVSAR